MSMRKSLEHFMTAGSDFQLIQIIFDTYDNNGIREERNRRRDEIIGKWKEREGEVMSRLRTVRDCYVETFQGSPPKSLASP